MSDDKRRRRDSAELLRRLASVRGVTSTALSDILKTLKAAPADASASHRRHTIEDAVHAQFDEFSHIEICTLDDGSAFRWEMIDPSRLLSEVVRRNRTVAVAYWVPEGSLAQNFPGTPPP